MQIFLKKRHPPSLSGEMGFLCSSNTQTVKLHSIYSGNIKRQKWTSTVVSRAPSETGQRYKTIDYLV